MGKLSIKKMPPSRILLIFFLGAIFIGSLLLMMPGATNDGKIGRAHV